MNYHRIALIYILCSLPFWFVCGCDDKIEGAKRVLDASSDAINTVIQDTVIQDTVIQDTVIQDTVIQDVTNTDIDKDIDADVALDVPVNLCEHVTCTSPESSSCEASILVEYAAQGTCNGEDGTCDYARHETPCGLGCESGACLTPVSPTAFLKASNAGEGDNFGSVVAVDGDTIVVGSHLEDSASQATPDDDSLGNSGAVYIFRRSAEGWAQEAYLKANVPGMNDFFGGAFAIDGDVLVVGAQEEESTTSDPNNNSGRRIGAAYVFRRSGTTWTQEAYLKASNLDDGDQFGFDVAVSGDTIVIGAPYEDSSGALSDNNTFNSGAAYVFEYGAGAWTQTQFLKADTPFSTAVFGSSVTIDGDTIAVGAPGEGIVGVGGRVGAVYLFKRGGGSWNRTHRLEAANLNEEDSFGLSVALNGDTLIVGTPNDDSTSNTVNGPWNNEGWHVGAATVFRFDGTAWNQEAYLKASNASEADTFGTWVDVSGDLVVVGAIGEDSLSPTTPYAEDGHEVGAAYVFERTGSDWRELAYLKAAAPNRQDNFGRSVCVDDGLVVVGVRWDDSASTGTAGDPTDNTREDSGAVFLFEP